VSGATQSADVGEIAVIADNRRIIIEPSPAHPFDFPLPAALTFTPAPGGFTVAFTAPGLHPAGTAVLPRVDDGAFPIPLPFVFPFLGVNYTSIWVTRTGTSLSVRAMRAGARGMPTG
jgi:hypothetical protein